MNITPKPQIEKQDESTMECFEESFVEPSFLNKIALEKLLRLKKLNLQDHLKDEGSRHEYLSLLVYT